MTPAKNILHPREGFRFSFPRVQVKGIFANLEAEDMATPFNVNVNIQKEKTSMKIKTNVKAGIIAIL